MLEQLPAVRIIDHGTTEWTEAEGAERSVYVYCRVCECRGPSALTAESAAEKWNYRGPRWSPDELERMAKERPASDCIGCIAKTIQKQDGEQGAEASVITLLSWSLNNKMNDAIRLLCAEHLAWFDRVKSLSRILLLQGIKLDSSQLTRGF